MSHVSLRKHSESIAFIEWDHPKSKANVLSEQALTELEAALDEVSKSSIEVCIFISKKSHIFIAGADLKEIRSISSKEQFSNKIDRVHKIFNSIRMNSKVSFISAIHGACLGGGLELALVCDYRMATLSPATTLGLPEVQLGFVPGFGGCVNLPRLIGFLPSINFIITSQSVSPQKAHKLGIVDEVVGIESMLESRAIDWARHIIDGVRPKKRTKRKQESFFMNLKLIRSALCFFIRRGVLKKTKGFYEAPLEALSLINKTYKMPHAQALKAEQDVFCRLASGSISQNLVQLFFNSEKVKKGNLNKPVFPLSKVAVLGGGVMGSEIAYVSAYQGFPVRLQDINPESLVRAKKHIHSLFDKQIKRRKISSYEKSTKAARISYATDYSGFGSFNLIIEAVVEDLGVKKQVIQSLAPHLKPDAIFASNTSSLSVTEMAKADPSPERFIGLHFFNPVHRLPLVEIIRGEKTSDVTVSRTYDWVQSIKKTPIVVKDSPGFLINRLLMPWLTEALWMWGEGASIQSIDKTFLKFGMPMGPFRLMDEVGLDVCVHVIKNFRTAGLDLDIPDFIDHLVQPDRKGKKTGLGFYHYDDKKQARSVNKELANAFCGSLDKSFFTSKDMLKRGLYRMVNESAKLLEEQVVEGAEWLDLGMIMGAGFPPFHGGVLRYADSIGVRRIYNKLENWTGRGATRFEPSSYLKNKAQKCLNFYH